MCRLLTNYYKYIIVKTRAVANKLNIFDFNKFKKVVKLYIMAVKNAKRMVIFFQKEMYKISKLYKSYSSKKTSLTREVKGDILILLFLKYIKNASPI